MLTIRSEQIALFEKEMFQQFENKMVHYLTQYFPDQCILAGENAVREEIRYNLKASEQYDIRVESDVARFTYLAFFLGRDFNLNPKYKTYIAVLSDRQRLPGERLNRLFDQLTLSLDDIEYRYIIGIYIPKAKIPLSKSAVTKADTVFYQKHPEMINGEKEHILINQFSGDQDQQTLRKEWMELYAQSGGEIESPGEKEVAKKLQSANSDSKKIMGDYPVGSTTIPCHPS